GGPEGHGFESQKAIIETNRCEMFYPFKGANYFPDAKEGDNFTDLLTDAAIEFVTAERVEPFYLHLCHFAMHSPIDSKPELIERFAEKAAALPKLDVDRVMDDYSHSPQKFRQDDPVYAGELSTLDTNIGRLVEALKGSDQYENTIIVFTGDNGGRSSYFKDHPTSVQPLRTGKTFIFEGGLRTPTLIRWPGHTSLGQSTEATVTSMDFYPTLLEMVGLPLRPEQHVDGVSLAPLFEGETIERDTLYWHFPHYQGEGSYPASAIRVGDLKLIHNYHHDDVLLYDVKQDPSEKENLAAKMPEKADAMRRQLMTYLEDVGAYIPQPK
ncbi:MAG: sulfatase-like hydrolase/transferase, partial [Verrucomicrobiota bacterium]